MVRWALSIVSIAALAGVTCDLRRGETASARPAASDAHAGEAHPRTLDGDRTVRRILYYVDPMHPVYRSDRPGTAPDCGMHLEPVYADAGPVAPIESPGRGAGASTDDGRMLRLTPDQESTAQLEAETVREAETAHEWRTAGRVVPDEALTYQVSAGVDGWVRRVFSDGTGTDVRRGQPLAAFYSKDLSAPQQAFVYALESHERLAQAASPAADQLALSTQQLATSRDNLRFFGMGDAQIDELGRRRREFFDIDLTAPAAGRILERHVAVGQRFMRGEILYRIADLSHVWVDADIQAGDGWSGAIVGARVSVGREPPLAARVAPSVPQFDGQQRTGRLRLVVDNRTGHLVPGMIVTVALQGPARAALTVHASALIDVGRTRHVFVARGHGEYELREVEAGWQERDRVEIRRGLTAGERVVVAGAFLLDSESRVRHPRVEGDAGSPE